MAPGDRRRMPGWALGVTLAIAGAACQHKEPAPAPEPAPRKPQATLFDHAMLAGAPARPRPDCSPGALLAAARHVGELEALASGAFKPAQRGKPKPAGCPTPEARLAANEVNGALPVRVSSCMSQDAPLDPEWDMVNSAVIALAACLDCDRPKADRAARCRWVADQVKRAEQSAKSRAGR